MKCVDNVLVKPGCCSTGMRQLYIKKHWTGN